MGCGKSSVGRRLSELLCCPFMDLDDVIVETTGRSIPKIFESEGEPTFRQMELEALKTVERKYQFRSPEKSTLVLALGGGAVMTKECAEIVMDHTCCVYLKASIETLMEHLSEEADGRPMLQSKTALEEADTSLRGAERRGNPLQERIAELMTLRSETYEKTAHIIVDTDGKSIEAIASEILSLI